MKNKKSEGERKFFKVPQTKYTVQQNIMLAMGLLLLLAGVFMLVKLSSSATNVFAVRPVILMSLGVVVLFLSLAFTQNSLFVFVGLLFLLCGGVTLLTDTGITPHNMKQLWPLFVVSCGVALFPAGVYKLKRIRTVYLFPAIMLVLFGCVFLLFSMHVVGMSFTKFIIRWWPLILVAFGIGLVVLFFIQQVRHKDFPYMVDDSLEDDEDSRADDTTGGKNE